MCISGQTDIIAGLSVGAMVVPQGMSYANLAGLPSVYGLYGAFVPVLVYSVLGSSRELVSRLVSVLPGIVAIACPSNENEETCWPVCFMKHLLA